MSKLVNDIERVNPVKLTYTPTGDEYVLDFSRESAVFAQLKGFDPGEIGNKPTVIVPNLFYFSLRKNHKNIAKNQADKLFETLFPNGMPSAVIERLVMLFQQASLVNIVADDDAKNSQTVVEMD